MKYIDVYQLEKWIKENHNNNIHPCDKFHTPDMSVEKLLSYITGNSVECEVIENTAEEGVIHYTTKDNDCCELKIGSGDKILIVKKSDATDKQNDYSYINMAITVDLEELNKNTRIDGTTKIYVKHILYQPKFIIKTIQGPQHKYLCVYLYPEHPLEASFFKALNPNGIIVGGK